MTGIVILKYTNHKFSYSMLSNKFLLHPNCPMWFWQEIPSCYLNLHFCLGHTAIFNSQDIISMTCRVTTKFWGLKLEILHKMVCLIHLFISLTEDKLLFDFISSVLPVCCDVIVKCLWLLVGPCLALLLWNVIEPGGGGHPRRKESLKEGLKVLKFRLIYCFLSASWSPAPCDQPFPTPTSIYSIQNAVHPSSNCKNPNHCWSPKISFCLFSCNNVKSKIIGHN